MDVSSIRGIIEFPGVRKMVHPPSKPGSKNGVARHWLDHAPQKTGNDFAVAGDFDIAIAGGDQPNDESGSRGVGLVTQKRPQDRLPLQTHVEEVASAPQFDPRRFLCRFINARALHGAGPMTRLFLNHRSKLISLDAAVKILVAELNIHHHHGAKLTGHTVRVGAATAAFGIGVPMVTIAHWMAHKDVKSTMGYIRHGTPSTAAAVVFFGHLRPTLPSGQPHYALH